MTLHAKWSAPTQLVSITLHKRGAEAEILTARQERILVYKRRIVDLAERYIRERRAVELYLVRSVAGNSYCTDIRPATRPNPGTEAA